MNRSYNYTNSIVNADDEEDYIENDPEEEEDDDERRKRVCGKRGGAVGTCQVENCRADLTAAKRYHRRHKVCEFHAKAPVVAMAGLRQRFCQQCSRFHEVGEFDEVKRSCRARLVGHNERRRKTWVEYSAAGAAAGAGHSQSQSQSQRGSNGGSVVFAAPNVNSSFKTSRNSHIIG